MELNILRLLKKIIFMIDPGISTIKALHEAGGISAYTTKLSRYDCKIVIVLSKYNTVQLRDIVRSVYKYSFMISEVKEYSGYLLNDQWEWFNNSLLISMKKASDNPAALGGTLVYDNDDSSENKKEESHSLATIDSEFKNIVGLNNVKSDLKNFYNHLEIITERKKRNLKTGLLSALMK